MHINCYTQLNNIEVFFMAEKKLNQRKGPDFIVKTIQNISFISWFIFFIVFIVFSLAKPKVQGFDREMGMITGQVWDKTILDKALYLMIFQIFLSGIGLTINTTRMKRKSDKLNKSLVLFGVFSLIGIFFFIVVG